MGSSPPSSERQCQGRSCSARCRSSGLSLRSSCKSALPRESRAPPAARWPRAAAASCPQARARPGDHAARSSGSRSLEGKDTLRQTPAGSKRHWGKAGTPPGPWPRGRAGRCPQDTGTPSTCEFRAGSSDQRGSAAPGIPWQGRKPGLGHRGRRRGSSSPLGSACKLRRRWSCPLRQGLG